MKELLIHASSFPIYVGGSDVVFYIRSTKTCALIFFTQCNLIQNSLSCEKEYTTKPTSIDTIDSHQFAIKFRVSLYQLVS